MCLLDENLVFDVGSNKGEDSDFYLRKGFRVVAVEANPLLAKSTSDRLGDWIRKGLLTVLPIGIGAERGSFTFYRNLQNDHWSSFDPVYGCRQGTRFEALSIACETISDLLDLYGTPRYLKIDVEGADRIIVREIARRAVKPRFLSVEEYGYQAIKDLQAAGYDRFQLVRQRLKFQTPPQPPMEGTYAAREFTGLDTGLFGLELPGAWLNAEDFASIYGTFVRRPDFTYVGPQGEWFDIHATNVLTLSRRMPPELN